MSEKSKSIITDLSLADLAALLRNFGEPPYRARQIFRWVYQEMATSFDQMTDLPVALRQKMGGEIALVNLKPLETVTAGDGKTVKTLFELGDGKTIETVLMLADIASEGRKRNTVCVSSQVGCPIGCPFCATGKQGFERNLTPGEIVEQVLYYQRRLMANHYEKVLDDAPPRVTNLVFMGMGEPLANYENVRQALVNVMSPEAFGLGARRITVSTCGLVPEIKRLAAEPFHVELAVSLHVADNSLRNKLVPINRKYPVEMLVAATTEYFEKTGRRPTFEYILLRRLNDSLVHARQLAHLLQGLNCHVNLIAANPTGDERHAPEPGQVRLFQDELTRLGISNTLRYSRGLDIVAACGQLRSRRQENSSEATSAPEA